MATQIRRIAQHDIASAAAGSIEALGPGPSDASPDELQARMERRIEHLAATDPDGSWVAEQDGRVVGIAQALVRDGVWGLSLLSVVPSLQARGIGRDLLDASLCCADGAHGALIMSSVDPKALRRYSRAGFELRPGVSAAGIPSGIERPAAVVAVTPAEAAPIALEAGRAVRGAGYAEADLAMLVAGGSELLVVPERGFAVHRGGSPRLLAALDEEAAAALLRACLVAGPRGGTVNVDCMIEGNDWAVRTCLDAGLALSPDGPMFTRGNVGPLRPWLPSGALL